MNLANGAEKQTDWLNIDWKKVNRRVRNLRQRIFRAKQEGNLKKLRSLQKLMLRSYSNRLVSVRRVTQTNPGRKTPGLDKVVVKTPGARGRLVAELGHFRFWQARPTRRVLIPKANGKFRPLGIQVIVDRCLGAVVKNALEPEWEAQFEGSSYGFRPGRGCHDAIEKIYHLAHPYTRKKSILDADISGAFDNISHEFLEEAIGQFPARRLIHQWLKAGYVYKEVFHPSEAGTAQGSVVSPLLANIALHGMEKALGVKHNSRGDTTSKRALVKYADDFAVFCESQEDAQTAKQILIGWLSERGLKMADEKTRLVHLQDGFNFLGFNIRHYPAPTTNKIGLKVLIKPSKSSVQKLKNRLKQEWRLVRAWNVKAIVARFNPIIRGWSNYFRIGVSSKIFQKLDYWMYHKQVRYAKRKHPTKSSKWLEAKYWGRLNLDRQDRWVFGDKKSGDYMLKFGWFKIERHILVKGKASADDPGLRDYWRKRELAKAKDFIPSRQKIARRQKGVCPVCRESLFNEEEVHLHHINPKANGGKDSYSNLELVHLYCHQQIHSKLKEQAKCKEAV
jgi:RNA-directed DNA polymerase